MFYNDCQPKNIINDVTLVESDASGTKLGTCVKIGNIIFIDATWWVKELTTEFRSTGQLLQFASISTKYAPKYINANSSTKIYIPTNFHTSKFDTISGIISLDNEGIFRLECINMPNDGSYMNWADFVIVYAI